MRALRRTWMHGHVGHTEAWLACRVTGERSVGPEHARHSAIGRSGHPSGMIKRSCDAAKVIAVLIKRCRAVLAERCRHITKERESLTRVTSSWQG
jgi:hypothetical protein